MLADPSSLDQSAVVKFLADKISGPLKVTVQCVADMEQVARGLDKGKGKEVE